MQSDSRSRISALARMARVWSSPHAEVNGWAMKLRCPGVAPAVGVREAEAPEGGRKRRAQRRDLRAAAVEIPVGFEGLSIGVVATREAEDRHVGFPCQDPASAGEAHAAWFEPVKTKAIQPLLMLSL